jgi:hypothetical protein
MNTSTQFVLIAKRILRELGTLRETVRAGFLGVQKQVEAIANEEQTKNEHDQSPPVVRAELYIPEAENTQDKRAKTEKKWLERLKVFLEAATLAAVVIYAIINYHMLCEMRKATEKAGISADAENSAADTARQSLVSAQRAFVIFQGSKFDVGHVKDTTGKEREYVEFTATWENVGTTSALVF